MNNLLKIGEYELSQEKKKINVLIVDNSDLNNNVIKEYLNRQERFRVVANENRLNQELFNQLEILLEPLVILLFMRDSPQYDITWIKKLKKRYPNLPIIVLSEYSYVLFFHTLMEAGVNNILKLDTSPEQIAQVIECTLDGHFFLPYSFYRKLNHITSVFTEVEIQTLELITLDYTNIQMAKELNVTIRGVESRLTKIYDKLEVSCRREAVKKIMQMK